MALQRTCRGMQLTRCCLSGREKVLVRMLHPTAETRVESTDCVVLMACTRHTVDASQRTVFHAVLALRHAAGGSDR